MTEAVAHRGYRICVAGGLPIADANELVNQVLDNRLECEHIFKDHERTFSAKVRFQGRPVMVKIPRARNRRKWERFLTLFRHSEGMRIFENLTLLGELQLQAPKPLFAAEKRQLGFVVDSFACYAFEEGRPAEGPDAERVVSVLLKLHNLGYLRTDPQQGNFLVTKRGIVFIDFRLKRPMFLTVLRKNLELAKLVRVYKEADSFVPPRLAQSRLFGLSRWLEFRLFRIRQRKRKIKRHLNG